MTASPASSRETSDRGRGGEGRRRRGTGRPARRRTCRFCQEHMEWIDHKNVALLRGFLTERGRILPGMFSGTCASHQRMLTTAIKRARVLALLPFTSA